jgi:hypothetical protein
MSESGSALTAAFADRCFEAHAITRANAASQSPWQEGVSRRISRWTAFRPNLLIRTHLYILASQALEAPYRPDVFRAPICWRFFNHESLDDLLIDERLVSRAEQLHHARIRSYDDLLGGTPWVGVPLFLARVMKESREPADILRVTAAIRASGAARRFREMTRLLREGVDAGDIPEVRRELDRYAALLNKEFGTGDGHADVLWTLGGAAAKTSVLQTPAAATDLGVHAAREGGKALGAWWRNRKFALIAKTIRQAEQAKSLQGEVRRIFNHRLPDEEIEFLRSLEAFPGAARFGRESTSGQST